MGLSESNTVHIKAKEFNYHILLAERNVVPALKLFDSSEERDTDKFTKSSLANQLWSRCRTKHEISNEIATSSWSSFHKQTL